MKTITKETNRTDRKVKEMLVNKVFSHYSNKIRTGGKKMKKVLILSVIVGLFMSTVAFADNVATRSVECNKTIVVEHQKIDTDHKVIPKDHNFSHTRINKQRSYESVESYPMPLPYPGQPVNSTIPENRIITYDLRSGTLIEQDIEIPDNGLQSNETKGGVGIMQNLRKENTNPEIDNFTALTQVSNPEDLPWRVNVKLFMFFPDSIFEGSGVMIDPMHVLTAGHCVYRPSVGFIPDSVIVAPAFDATTSGEFGDARAVQYHFWGGWYYDADWDHDMGIIDLDRPIGGLCGWNGYGYNNSSSFFTGSTFYNPGYPGEYPYTGNYMFTWHGNFDNVYTYQLRVNREAFGGQSGSGAYHTSGGNRTVYCELSNGTSTYHNHVRITQDKYYDINSIISADKPTSVDLIPLAVDIEPSFTYAGYPLDSMSFYVHNYSTVYYNDMVYADIYLSQDSIITTSDVLLQTSSFYAFIDSDSTVKFNVNPPPTLPIIEGDNYFIGVILDIADANPSNNSSNIQDAAYIYVGPAYIAPLTDGVVRSESRTLAHCKYNQNAYYWAVAGVRPPSGSDWDIRVFNDTLFENQMAASVYGGSAVDFVVGNYNSYHNPLGWDGVLVNKYSGVSPCKIEYEGGYDILSAPSQNTGFTWDAGHVVSIWDVYLNAGDTYIYTLDVTGGSFDPGFAIYMPYDGEYYAGRSEAAVLTDAYGSGQDESFAYYAPVTGWYAFVVWSNDDNSGTFNININEDLPVVSIDMIPDNPPVSVRQGGFFTFTGILNNNTDQQLLGDVWIMLRLPNDQMYGPIEQFNNIPMDPYENLTYPGVRQNIPSYAMLGEYEYFAFCGDYPGYITDQASFMFNVTPALASANGNNDWNLLSWFGDETEELPHVSALHDNFPNPFNPVTTIDYDLTSDGDVTLEVYNLMGQKMETLVNGYESAGQKSITWDASTFSSGVYFYRLTTVDNVFTKKMTLMK